MQKISPKYYASKLSNSPTIEDYIDVYEDQINGWYLRYARQMHADQHAGFAALQLVFSYFEGHAIFYKGQDSNGRSPKFFKDGFLAVFPELEAHSGIKAHSGIGPSLLDTMLDAFYKDGRCGFYHLGMARGRFSLSDDAQPIRVGVDPANPTTATQVILDRRKFVDRVRDHFQNYVARLRNPKEVKLRENFKKALKIVHGRNLRI